MHCPHMNSNFSSVAHIPLLHSLLKFTYIKCLRGFLLEHTKSLKLKSDGAAVLLIERPVRIKGPDSASLESIILYNKKRIPLALCSTFTRDGNGTK